MFATVLDATKIRARKRLFMTATPRYYTGRVKQEAKEADWEVASMDEEAKFGPVLHRLSFAQAIDQDLLSDYQVVVVGVSDDEAHDLAERGAFVTHDGDDDHRRTDALSSDRPASGDGEARPPPRRQLPLPDRLREPVRRFAARDERVAARSPPPDRDALDGSRLREDDRRGARRCVCAASKGVEGDQRGVLTNARCLGEGVDVPTLDGVAFIDPRRSQVDVVQAVGRAIRKAEDKTRRHHRHPRPRRRERRPRRRLWRPASSTASGRSSAPCGITTRFSRMQLDELRRERGRRGYIGRASREDRARPSERDRGRFARAFDARVVEARARSGSSGTGCWSGLSSARVMLVCLEHYVDEGMRLGRWVNEQRVDYRRQLLSGGRSARLEALPGWEWTAFARARRSWDTAFGHLEGFVAREGHARVPRPHVEDDFHLGNWVAIQRAKMRPTVSPANNLLASRRFPAGLGRPEGQRLDPSLKEAGRVIDAEPTAAGFALRVSGRGRLLAAGLLLLFAVVASGSADATAQTTYRIDQVTDGDTVVLRNGQKVRLVQIDTPEVYFGTECYGPQASATTKRLLPEGTPCACFPNPPLTGWTPTAACSGTSSAFAEA